MLRDNPVERHGCSVISIGDADIESSLNLLYMYAHRHFLFFAACSVLDQA